ncbi:ArsR/SmtB family transcription factor [Kocuria kalidii]|uniref:ArsR/SmtB family transcription factor n=1 Tax=Kocuria kalidii TaxID=3376283 RepID=UPI0037B6D1F7
MVVRNELTDLEVDRIFQALADTTRRDIVTRVLRQEQSVSALAGYYRMSFAAVQKHVAVLERAALVTKQRRGREQVVHGNMSTLRRAAGLLDEYEELWRGRTRRIEDLLAEDVPPEDRGAEQEGSRTCRSST